MSPSDAAVAARSYPRRYRALLVRPDEPDPDVVHRRPSPEEASAVEHADQAASDLAATADALQGVLRSAGPVDLRVPSPARSGTGGEHLVLATVLDRLTSAATALASAIESVHGDEWKGAEPEGGAGGGVTALDVARLGVHAGIHHLKAAERTLARVR